MKYASALLFVAVVAAPFLPAQVNLRNPDINAETEDGGMIAEAAASEDVQERIGILEQFVDRFSESRYIGYALLQLQGGYVQTQQHEKTVEVGKRLLEMAPEDVEVRHNINQALVAQQKWEELYPLLVEARPLAEKAAATPKPEDPDEDELAIWQGRIDYASGVTDYLEWAMNTAMTQQTQPAQQIAWMDRLRENYPDSDYSKGLEARYVTAYQQQGDMTNAVEWMKKAIEAGVVDETYHYTLSEDALNRQDNETAQAEAEKGVGDLGSQGQAGEHERRAVGGAQGQDGGLRELQPGPYLGVQEHQGRLSHRPLAHARVRRCAQGRRRAALRRAGVSARRLLRAARHPGRQHQASAVLDDRGVERRRPVPGSSPGRVGEDQVGDLAADRPAGGMCGALRATLAFRCASSSRTWARHRSSIS